MTAPAQIDQPDEKLSALCDRLLADMAARMTPEDRQRYRDALNAADSQTAPSNAARYITLREVLTDVTGAGVFKMSAAMEHLNLPQLAYPTADQLDAMMDYIAAHPEAGAPSCSCPDACGQRGEN